MLLASERRRTAGPTRLSHHLSRATPAPCTSLTSEPALGGGYLLLDGSRHHLDLTFPGTFPQDTDYTVILYAWKFQTMHVRGKTITLEDC